MPTPADHSAPALQDRYGAPRQTHRTTVRIAWAAGIVGALVMAWIMWGAFRPTVHNQLVGFDVSDPALTSVTFNVIKPADRSARCTVEALNTGFAQVGVLQVEVGPAQEDLVTLHREVRTSEPATTAIISSCELID
ncbi:DUF4307 domain-containing protein [Pseudactinotalea sp. HY158]|uniref:DUF4307 domain-containing protein n=1 Tax=unclassified Pseudactinotalea TaxID=2649176 RepID=UPI0018834507|nr:DUF4307 domain-containing protein [Pseudactinotalea sp. HY158]